MELNQLWAKSQPFQSVVSHGLISGYVCRALCEHYLCHGVRMILEDRLKSDRNSVINFLSYLTSIHDIGKINYHFQCRDPEMRILIENEMKSRKARGMNEMIPLRVEAYRHEIVGRIVAKRIWEKEDYDPDAVELYSKIIGAHHQKNDRKGRADKGYFFPDLQKKYDHFMRKAFLGTSDLTLIMPAGNEGSFEALVLGIVVLSDWIASNERFADAESWIACDDFRSHIEKLTKEFLEKSELRPVSLLHSTGFTDLWTNIPHSGMRPLQRSVEQLFGEKNKYQLVLIEAPMGEGKTEAGVYAALRMAEYCKKDGFYIALPTAATSNQMVQRMRQMLEMHQETADVRLLHSMAWLMDDDEQEAGKTDSTDSEEMRQWLAPLRRGLLGQFAVGTIDQVMLSVSVAKYSVLRLLGLANKVLVIDEIHSYDVYMGGFIICLLEWCRELDIPVVMLSATLPPNLKRKLLKPYTVKPLSQAYPQITAVSEKDDVTEMVIEGTARSQTFGINFLPYLNDPDRIAETAVKMVENGGCICILLNTVQQAQSVYQKVREIYSGDSMLFHARFPANRRNELEQECIRKYGKDKTGRPKQSILIATQVVEQSLDVDFDAMITAVAPVDLVVQRMGRVFRHSETIRPERFEKASLTILTPQNDNFGIDAVIYPEPLLRQCLFVLKNRTEIRIPDDIEQIVSDGYDERKAPADQSEAWLEKKIEDQIAAGRSSQYLINKPEKMYSPLCDDFFLDDSETNAILSVKTRLSEPSLRIALLDNGQYGKLEQIAFLENGEKHIAINNKTKAKEIMEQSVSVRKKKIETMLPELRYLIGRGLIRDVYLFPSENGICTGTGGKSIVYDRELGVYIREGKNETVF